MLEQLDQLFQEFQSVLGGVQTQADALELKSRFLGKKGQISTVLKSLKNVPADERKEIGAKSNEYKREMEELFSKKLSEIGKKELDAKLLSEWIDPTLRSTNIDTGLSAAGLHPITMIQREIEDAFLSMGFEILDGPHIEDDYHNFEALNIPTDHPARDMQDTFWFEDMEHLFRTQTSPIQIRGMETRKPPFKFIAPGKVFRCERSDASHEAVFHQIEAMMIDKDINVSHLEHFTKALLKVIFKKDVEIRLRPGYFPFVEPGFEIDIACLICNGKGCSVCKQVGWLELLGSGMVHPNVLRAGGVDPNEYNGFAFGLGLDRLAMMRYGIDDIRHLLSGDLRFVSQFKAY